METIKLPKLEKAPDFKHNLYVCKNGHEIKTIDRLKGVTPMFIQCEECEDRAVSSMYQMAMIHAAEPDCFKPTHEWRQPTQEELQKEIQKYAERLKESGIDNAEMTIMYMEHYDQHGLGLYKIETNGDA